ncbi:hypothetical protein [Hyphomicrobium sp.]|jgi:hypothetical protein|uniref:hypothetical protein n=1 Tax=Hyphomicrobium sp. TaxID=82 RepID=UPI002BDDAB83|nr:hypothetical protein [Hyphomicrobium sp.]HVZ04021.1 hypothetical protein [Hyphomicrobium sp.]
MFAALFKRAEQSVDSALGDLGNRILIAIPFLIAVGFGAASLTMYLDRLYGAELGTLMVAGVFCLLGLCAAIVVRLRKHASVSNSAATGEAEPADKKAENSSPQSIFDDDTVMAVMSSAAPIVIPAMVRTGLKNWPILLAAAAGLYVASRSEHAGAAASPDTPSPPSS